MSIKTCPKCGYTRQPTDTAPSGECPGCGIIFSKYLEQWERREAKAAEIAETAARASRARQTRSLGIKAIVVTAAVFGVGYFAYNKNVERLRLERLQEVDAGVARIKNADAKWKDASKLASSTSRIALSGPVGKLQDLHREVGSIAVPACLIGARDKLAQLVMLEVDVYLQFMRDVKYESTSSYYMALELASMAAAEHGKFLASPNAPCASFVETGKVVTPTRR